MVFIFGCRLCINSAKLLCLMLFDVTTKTKSCQCFHHMRYSFLHPFQQVLGTLFTCPHSRCTHSLVNSLSPIPHHAHSSWSIKWFVFYAHEAGTSTPVLWVWRQKNRSERSTINSADYPHRFKEQKWLDWIGWYRTEHWSWGLGAWRQREMERILALSFLLKQQLWEKTSSNAFHSNYYCLRSLKLKFRQIFINLNSYFFLRIRHSANCFPCIFKFHFYCNFEVRNCYFLAFCREEKTKTQTYYMICPKSHSLKTIEQHWMKTVWHL